ncbi:MAG: DUF881 domain-containing protein [Thermaerobacter sp.]|nr:DUF881 domain-containing protein [Thermaerobacter sp.]
MKPYASLVAIVGLVIGLFVGMELHLQSGLGQNLPYERFVAMANLLQQREDARTALAAQLQMLHSSPAPTVAQQALQAMQKSLAKARKAAGLTPLRGAGIVLTLNDSSLPTQFGVDPNEYLLHDQDLLSVINDLNAAGAEAISLNGLRLTAATDVHCAGAVVSVGGVRTSIPVTILAIGKPSALTKSLQGPTGELTLLSLYGIQIHLHKSESVTVPAYTPPTRRG